MGPGGEGPSRSTPVSPAMIPCHVPCRVLSCVRVREQHQSSRRSDFATRQSEDYIGTDYSFRCDHSKDSSSSLTIVGDLSKC